MRRYDYIYEFVRIYILYSLCSTKSTILRFVFSFSEHSLRIAKSVIYMKLYHLSLYYVFIYILYIYTVCIASMLVNFFSTFFCDEC